MKIIEISIGAEHKINVGNYETLLCPVKFSAEIEDGDDIEKCKQILAIEAKTTWAIESLKLIRLYRMRKPTPESQKDFDDLMAPTIAALKGLVRK